MRGFFNTPRDMTKEGVAQTKNGFSGRLAISLTTNLSVWHTPITVWIHFLFKTRTIGRQKHR
jgi:hypothetical protein